MEMANVDLRKRFPQAGKVTQSAGQDAGTSPAISEGFGATQSGATAGSGGVICLRKSGQDIG
jgi:hypothetical protein